MATISGTSGNDSLNGTDGDDTILGLAGDDSLIGSAGNDSIQGGDGTDRLAGGLGIDTLEGGAGTDRIRYFSAAELVGDVIHGNQVGGAADNTTVDRLQLFSAETYDLSLAGSITQIDRIDLAAPTLAGTTETVKITQAMVATADANGDGVAGDILVIAYDGSTNLATLTNLVVDASALTSAQSISVFSTDATGDYNLGNDSLIGGAGNDYLQGGGGADTLIGNAGNDSMLAGDGNDTLTGGAGNDTIDGGAEGQYGDTVDYSTSGVGVQVNLAAGIATDGFGGTDTLTDIEHVRGTVFSDNLVGNGKFNLFHPGAGNDVIDGGEGRDVISYEDAPAAVTVNLKTGNASGASIGTDNLTSIEAAHGSNFNDSLTLTDGAGYLFGRGGNDTLVGGTGSDNFIPGSGNDSIVGGAGTDQVSYMSDVSVDSAGTPTMGVTVNLTAGLATDNWGGSDTLASIENASGSDLADTLMGDANSNYLEGLGGNDTISGGAGDDNLNGGSGNDSLDGGLGYDFLESGTGNDTVNGGAFTNIADISDTASYQNSTTAVNVNLGLGASFGNGTVNKGTNGTDTLININFVRGSELADTITGSASLVFEQFEGGGGNDTIDGGAIDPITVANSNRISYQNAKAAVTVDLAAGTAVTSNSTIAGNSGTDTLLNFNQVRGSANNDTLYGSNRTDITESFEGRGGDDVIDGRGGIDVVRFSNASGGVTASLVSGTGSGSGVGTDTFTNVEGLFGSGYNDTLTGGNTNSDALEVFRGDAGSDTIDGGSGYDRANYDSATSAVTVTLNDSADGTAIDGLGGTDTLRNIEGVRGSEYNDTITGNSANNGLEGMGGNDTILGLAGDDTLIGGAGNDTLRGGSGNDVLNGGEQRNLGWRYGQNYATSDYDTADYTDVTIGGIRLDLSTMTVTGINGADVGTDTLRGIEDVRGTRQADSVVGSFAALSGNSEAAGDQHQVDLELYGGSDTVTLAKVQSMPWLDGPYLGYWWSQTAITTTFTGSVGTISYGAGSSQAAGADTVDGVTSFGDTSYNDRFDFSGMTSNFQVGARWNYVSLNQGGNDTIIGNGDTIVNFSGNTLLSTTGKGIDVRLAAPGTTSTVDMTHLSRSSSWSFGIVTLSNIEEVRGTNLDDTLVGGAYDDYEGFRGRGGNDFIDGGSGEDRADYWGATAGVTVNLAAGTVSGDNSVGSDTLRSIERIRGTAFDDVYDARGFSASSTNAGSLADFNQFDGRGGNDTIYGNGKTMLTYGASAVAVEVNLATGKAWALNPADRSGDLNQYVGTDTFTGVYRVRGTALGDSLLGGGTGWIYGETALEMFDPDAGNDTVNGYGGFDIVRYASSTAAITVDLRLATGQVQDGMGGVDTLINVEGVQGSDFNDVMIGSDSNTGYEGYEYFQGRKGNDTINGGGGYDEVGYDDDPTNGVVVNLATGVAQDGWGGTDTLSNIEGVEGSWKADSITGSSADNRLDGHGGNDTLDGGAGSDWAEYNNESSAVTVNLALGTASGVSSGNDTLISIENVEGTIYADTLTGDTGNNQLSGLAGNDTLNGGAGDDSLTGGAGNDSISGGDGFDKAYFAGNKSGYTVTTTANGVTVVDLSGAEGTDTLTGIEQLVFADGTTSVGGGTKPTLSGIAYDWKNHMLLQDVAVSVKGGGAPAEGANAPIQFKALTWDASGHASVEVWTRSTSAAESLGFDLNISNATGITFTAGTLPNTSTGGTGWTLITNTLGTNLSVGGFANDSSAAVAAGDFKLGTITFETATAQRADLQLLSGDVGSSTASAYGLSLARTSSSATGAFSISNLDPGSYDMTASRATTDIGNAITSADALSALKIAVGLNPNPDPDGTGPMSAPMLSPYQFMAADVVGTDGRVTSADALAILKMAVKLPTAPAKEWMFVEETRDFWNETAGQFTLNRNNTTWDHSISTTMQAGTTTGTVNLVGVLKGDVNGSWAAPAGSVDLDTVDPTHFTALSSIFGMPVGQFGVV